MLDLYISIATVFRAASVHYSFGADGTSKEEWRSHVSVIFLK